MLSDISLFLYNWRMPLDLLCYTIIFMGTFYVAVHNRKLPVWHLTPLWYVGLASLFISFTILLEYIFGTSFELSYTNVGHVGETLSHFSLAFLVGTMFVGTMYSDIKNKNKRKREED